MMDNLEHILDLLQCPECHQHPLMIVQQGSSDISLNCQACGKICCCYNGVLDLLAERDSALVQKAMGRGRARFYDAFFARAGFRRLYSRWRFRDEVNEFIDFFDLQSEDMVLDVGCGTGNYTVEFAKKIRKNVVIGLDLSLGMLEICEKNAHKAGVANILLLRGNAENLPFKKASLPHICHGCLNLLDDIVPSLRNAYHCLAPGGILFGMSLAESETVKSKKIQKIFGRIMQSNLVNRAMLEKYLKKVGFVDFEYRIEGFVAAFRAVKPNWQDIF